MATYKQLLSETEFLKVKARSRALRGTDLVAILYDERKIIFKTRSATDPRIIWVQSIEITDAYIDNILSQKTFSSVQSLIQKSDLRIHCTCPAFSFWGFKYKAWKHGYGIEKETRAPRIRNPFEQGFVCFIKGTPVLTPDGYKPIETLTPKDIVLSHKNRPQKITCTSRRQVRETITLTYNAKDITCTITHPFFVFRDNGLQKVPANELRVGDLLLTPGSTLDFDDASFDVIQLEAITHNKGRQFVYNITVAEDHSYIVNGACVSNCKHLYLVLETYPFWAATLAKKFKKYFEDVQKYREEHPEVSDSVRHQHFVNQDKARHKKLKLSNPYLG